MGINSPAPTGSLAALKDPDDVKGLLLGECVHCDGARWAGTDDRDPLDTDQCVIWTEDVELWMWWNGRMQTLTTTNETNKGESAHERERERGKKNGTASYHDVVRI